MTRAQRRSHLLIWTLLAPLALIGVALLIVNAPAAPNPQPDAQPGAQPHPQAEPAP